MAMVMLAAVHWLSRPVHTPFTEEQRPGNRLRVCFRRGPCWAAAPASPRTGCQPVIEEESVQERTPAEVLSLVESEGIEVVDLRFCDLPGLTQHFSVPTHQLTEDAFAEGYG